jgi:hypothetical protein
MLIPYTSYLPINLTHYFKVLVIVFALITSSQSLAQDIKTITIPTVSDARVFAEFKDKMPAVVNYFTRKTEAEVITFYQNEYGEPLQQERKRGRLTLNFNQEKNTIRIVISQQDSMRQVDVMIENTLKN